MRPKYLGDNSDILHRSKFEQNDDADVELLSLLEGNTMSCLVI